MKQDIILLFFDGYELALPACFYMAFSRSNRAKIAPYFEIFLTTFVLSESYFYKFWALNNKPLKIYWFVIFIAFKKEKMACHLRAPGRLAVFPYGRFHKE